MKEPGDGFHLRRIELGASDGNSIEVVRGPHAGELAIDHPRPLISDEEIREKLGTTSDPSPTPGAPR